MDNKSILFYKLYQTFSQVGDLVIFVMKDCKNNLIPHSLLPFSIMTLQIQGEVENFQWANIYARDSQLKCVNLVELFSTFSKLICVGDLNAKHNKLLPRSQIYPYNSTQEELYTFMEGRDTIWANLAQACIHNATCPMEWTHITYQGTPGP